MKKVISQKHYMCAKCGGCYFGDEESAIACYDSHGEDEYLDSDFEDDFIRRKKVKK